MVKQNETTDEFLLAQKLLEHTLGSPAFSQRAYENFIARAGVNLIAPLSVLSSIGLSHYEISDGLTPTTGELSRMFDQLEADSGSSALDALTHELITATLTCAALPWPAVSIVTKSDPYKARYATSDGLSGFLRLLERASARHSFLIALDELLQSLPIHYTDILSEKATYLSFDVEEYEKAHGEDLANLSLLLMEIISEAQLTAESFALYQGELCELMGNIAERLAAEKAEVSQTLFAFFALVREEMEVQQPLWELDYDA